MKCITPHCKCQATKFYSYISDDRKLQLRHRCDMCFASFASGRHKQFYTEQEYIILTIDQRL